MIRNETILAPSGNYRNINIWPDAGELLNTRKPFLRENKVLGGYDGIEQYLDIQFRLLREDFIRPLRELISEYIRTKNDPKAAKKVLNVYRNVRISDPRNRGEEMIYSCQFDWKQSKGNYEEDEDRLKGGSLVCLSSNDFRTIEYFATIAGDRRSEKCAAKNNNGKGQRELSFRHETSMDSIRKTFVMIEAPAFFMAYRFNLEVLQYFGKHNFPLERYIINVNKNVSSPAYLVRKNVYQLSNGLPKADRNVKLFNVQLLTKHHWPGHEHFGLNESQFEAFRAALTKQLVIIQGPPGTGKTYVGLRIIEALINNVNHWPILIVCCTNHALDQFLEGILEFCDANELIRIGGGSKSEILEQCNLSNVRSRVRIRGKDGDIAVLKRAKIIGMTTNGAAIHRHIIDGVRPKITIVEEAAEVQETHIITALTEHIDHLILIGDHKQLRPRNAVHELATDYNMEISLFERLIKNGVQHYQLEEQHRMRPCISSLLRPHIYETLFDHPSVEEYENVQGMAHNMFFINHRQNENNKEDSMSVMNIHEAKFIVALCNYLIQQGYETSQVTILAMYKAQSEKIKDLLRGEPLLEGICATTVDNFQGEENEIVLVSFVRSNNQNVIGFLKTANRINVAFSRARIGLYCVGNFENMAKRGGGGKEDHFPWNKLVQKLRKENAIGDGLEICCQNHGTKSVVKRKEDFLAKAPTGGCLNVCNNALMCGHLCSRACHVFNEDADHAKMQRKCKEICNRSCPAGHPCSLKCHYGKQCKQCTILVQKTLVKCKHTLLMFCWQKPASVRCTEKVQAQPPCGHTVTVDCCDANSELKLLSACGESCNVEPKCQPEHRCPEACHYPKPCGKCVVAVDKLRTECQHTVQVQCWVNPSLVHCPLPCKRNRSCGHKCKQSCGAICDDVVCVEKVQAMSTCGHTVTIDCGDANSELKLLSACGGSCNVEPKCQPEHRCPEACHYPKPCGKCVVAIDKLRTECQHTVQVHCGVNPSLAHCPHPCKRNRSCGHKCKQSCGAICGDVVCVEKVHAMSPCGHTVTIDCCDTKSDLKLLSKCSEPCNVELKCGHLCKGSCGRCMHGRLHISCEESCAKPLVCRHPPSTKVVRETINILQQNQQFANLPIYFSNIYSALQHQLIEPTNYKLIKIKIDLLEPIREICLSLCKKPRAFPSCPNDIIERFHERMQICANFIVNYNECEQKRNDVKAETSILKLMAGAIVEASALPLDKTGRKLLDDAFEFVRTSSNATKMVRNEFSRLTYEAYKYKYKHAERQMSLSMGYQRGNWVICSAGHSYYAVDYGVTMYQRKCPKCESQSRSTNRVSNNKCSIM